MVSVDRSRVAPAGAERTTKWIDDPQGVAWRPETTASRSKVIFYGIHTGSTGHLVTANDRRVISRCPNGVSCGKVCPVYGMGRQCDLPHVIPACSERSPLYRLAEVCQNVTREVGLPRNVPSFSRALNMLRGYSTSAHRRNDCPTRPRWIAR